MQELIQIGTISNESLVSKSILSYHTEHNSEPLTRYPRYSKDNSTNNDSGQNQTDEGSPWNDAIKFMFLLLGTIVIIVIIVTVIVIRLKRSEPIPLDDRLRDRASRVHRVADKTSSN